MRRGRMSMARMALPELTQIHERFLALGQIARERFGDSLGGRLLLGSQLDPEGVATVIASSVTGAASLCVDANADRLREGLRAGFVDFVVANLDEALRILKNEIRRARPVSVGVTAQPEPAIDAMIERGLQPDLLCAIPPKRASVLLERGAVSLPFQLQAEPETSILAWTVAEGSARTMRSIAELASAALDPARNDTTARRRWLERSPRYLGRPFAAQQCMRMTSAEAAAFVERAHGAFPAARITRDGQTL